MSDSEGDFSDELLELAGATEKKRKRKQGSSKTDKRRKAEASGSFSEGDGPESEEESDDTANPYPLDGKYINEADRLRLLDMPEIDREEVLAQRQEEMQRIQDKRNLAQMLQAQKGGVDQDSVSKAAKRQHAVRGATKEKSRKLDELKARRRAKDDSKRSRHSPGRARSSSPMDMGTEDEDEEDGQVSKLEQEEERERRLLSNGSKPAADDPPATQEDLTSISLSRNMIAKHCMAPWFEDYVKGTWVRYLIGNEDNHPVYRLCEIQNLAASLVKPYLVNNQTVNQAFELKHGKSAKIFPMDKVSNSAFTQREFDRLVKVCESDHVKLPTRSAVEKKRAQMTKLENQVMTESDISAMLQRKKALQTGNKPSPGNWIVERTRITQARMLAIERNDQAEINALDLKLAEIDASKPRASAPANDHDISTILAKVNERNRKANMEATRRAEHAEAERKRRERKLAASGTATPTRDPSARLKTVPRMFESRSGTPNVNGNGTPLLVPQASTPRSVSPLPPTATTTSGKAKDDFTARVLESIEIDLGDF